MKIYGIKNVVSLLTSVMLSLMLSVPALSYAQEGDNGEHKGFEQGKHEGHQKDNGKRKGFENEKNPWNSYYNSGEDFDLTIHNHAVVPTITFTETYNSEQTIQEVLASIVGEDTTGFYLQECYEDLVLLLFGDSDCDEGESPEPLDSSLTLEDAGLVEDPEAHLVYKP